MSTISFPQVSEVTIREATGEDEQALLELAERDSASVPAAPLMIGEVDGEIRVAISVTNGATIADPFHRSAEILALVYTRADQLRSRSRRRARVIARTPESRASATPRLRTAA
jgi:hypothetical protein